MAPKRTVYILRSVSDPSRPYVGLTHDLSARLSDHNAGRCHTAIELPDEPRAIRFERYLKSESGRAFAKRHFG